MNTMKHFGTCIVGLFIFSCLCSTNYAQVGIGTDDPQQELDVVGNINYSGALMPNNDPGEEDQVLVSGGSNNSSKWGMKLLNTGQTLELGKYFSGLFDISGRNDSFILVDEDCTPTSSCNITWVTLDSTVASNLNWARLHVIMVPDDGQWEVIIRNDTGDNSLFDMQFAFYAQY